MENAYWQEYEQFGTEDMPTLVLEYENLAATIVTGRNKIRGKEGPSVNAVDVTAQGYWMRADLDSAYLNGEKVELETPALEVSESCVWELIDHLYWALLTDLVWHKSRPQLTSLQSPAGSWNCPW